TDDQLLVRARPGRDAHRIGRKAGTQAGAIESFYSCSSFTESGPIWKMTIMIQLPRARPLVHFNLTCSPGTALMSTVCENSVLNARTLCGPGGISRDTGFPYLTFPHSSPSR